MNCIIIEDQAPAQRVLKKFIADAGNLTLVDTFSNAISATEFLKSNAVDLIFLDIHLPKLSGIDFLKTLKNPPSVILTTAFSEYAVQSYELSVVDYLVKPFSFERFLLAISKVQPQKNTAENTAELGTTFFLKSGYEFIKIDSRKIQFIQSDSDYTEIHLSTKKLLSPETLQYWEQKLSQKGFIRVHKSYLINIDFVQKIAGNSIYLPDEKTVPLGRAYKESFLEKYVRP